MILELQSGIPVVILDDPQDLKDMISAMDQASKWTERTPQSISKLHYALMALEAQKMVIP